MLTAANVMHRWRPWDALGEIEVVNKLSSHRLYRHKIAKLLPGTHFEVLAVQGRAAQRGPKAGFALAFPVNLKDAENF